MFRNFAVMLLMLSSTAFAQEDDLSSMPQQNALKPATVFPDYQSKISSDTVLDYRPALLSRIKELPSVNSKTFTQAVTTLVLQNIKALEKPGSWIKDNVTLGANPDEYLPSDEELLAAEMGDRLADYVRSTDVSELIEAWKGEALLPLPLEYNRFEYRHVDVMGSGRFFYASKPIKTVIKLRQKNNQ